MKEKIFSKPTYSLYKKVVSSMTTLYMTRFTDMPRYVCSAKQVFITNFFLKEMSLLSAFTLRMNGNVT